MRFNWFVLLIYFFSQSLWGVSSLWAGREWSALGNETEVISLGGVTAGHRLDGSFISANSALVATQLRKTILLNSGYGTGGIFPTTLSYLHPTDYGVWGGVYRQTYQLESKDFFFTLSPFFAKEISNFFLIGIKLNIDYSHQFQSSEVKDLLPWGVNGDVSLSMRPDYTFKQGILIVENWIISAQVRNVGLIPWRKPKNEKLFFKVMDLLRAGVGVDFLKSSLGKEVGWWSVRAMSDLALTYPINVSYHLGLSNDFFFHRVLNRFSLMLGYFYHPFTPSLFPVTTGLRIDFTASDVNVSLKYGLVFGKGNTKKIDHFYHSFTFMIHFGDHDLEPPQIETEKYGEEGVIQQGEIE